MTTTVEPTGILFTGICDIQTEKCTAQTTATLTAVWSSPGRRQINVCRSCLEEMIRSGEWRVDGARIGRRADVAVYDDTGKLQVVVEAKYRRYNDTSTGAVEIRQNLLAHAGLQPAPFFMVAFPDHFYVWKQHVPEHDDRPADYDIDAREIVRKYSHQHEKNVQMNHREFEKLIYYWMNDMTHPKDESEVPEWMKSSGIYQRIKNGLAAQEVPF